jgi:hypothetical protein
MTRDDLRPHGHTKSGDGGDIDGIDVDSDGEPYVSGTDDDGNSTLDSAASGGLSVADSGQTTVAANGSQTITISPSRDTNLLLSAYPDSGYTLTFSLNNLGGDTAAVLEYDGGWQIVIDETGGEEITVEWTVYEL